MTVISMVTTTTTTTVTKTVASTVTTASITIAATATTTFIITAPITNDPIIIASTATNFTHSLSSFIRLLLLLLSLLLIPLFLTQKRVISCDAQSNLILGDLDGSINGNGDDMQSIQSTDPSASTCSICLETFQFTDRVTWSQSSICRHVFHSDCLMEWLANPNHDDCPTCRAQIINVEQDHDIPPLDTRNSGMFMVMNGLISVVSRQQSSSKGGINNIGALSDKSYPFSSGLQIAFRRVSSGIYSHLSQTLDLEDDESTDEWKQPIKLRRTLSEGGPKGPFRTSSYTPSNSATYAPLSVRSRSTWEEEEEVEEVNIHDIESQKDPLSITPTLRRTLSEGPSPTRQPVKILISRPGLFATRCFRRSSSRNYGKLNKAVEEEYDNDDEDDLHFGNSWRDDEDSSSILQHPTVLHCEN